MNADRDALTWGLAAMLAIAIPVQGAHALELQDAEASEDSDPSTSDRPVPDGESSVDGPDPTHDAAESAEVFGEFPSAPIDMADPVAEWASPEPPAYVLAPSPPPPPAAYPSIRIRGAMGGYYAVTATTWDNLERVYGGDEAAWAAVRAKRHDFHSFASGISRFRPTSAQPHLFAPECTRNPKDNEVHRFDTSSAPPTIDLVCRGS